MQLLDRTEQELRDAETEQRASRSRTFLEAQLAQVKPNSVMFSDTGERILTPADRSEGAQVGARERRALYAGTIRTSRG